MNGTIAAITATSPRCANFAAAAMVCRDFTETSYRGGRSFTRTGTACREMATAIGALTE